MFIKKNLRREKKIKEEDIHESEGKEELRREEKEREVNVFYIKGRRRIRRRKRRRRTGLYVVKYGFYLLGYFPDGFTNK